VEFTSDGWSHGFEVDRAKRSDGAGTDGDGLAEIIGLELGHYWGRSFGRMVDSFTLENWRKMGLDLCSKCTSLKRLDLQTGWSRRLDGSSDFNLSMEVLSAIFGVEGAYQCPLESLDLSNIKLDSTGMEIMLPFFMSMTRTLRYVHLNNCELGSMGPKHLSEALTNYDHLHELHIRLNSIGDFGMGHISNILDNVCIDSLHLGCNGITDISIERLLAARNAAHLRELYLENNPIERNHGFDAIASFLSREDSELRVLRIGVKYPGHLWILLQSLQHNTKMEMLGLSGLNLDGLIDYNCINFMQNLVCKRSSFASLCQSNHLLRIRCTNDYLFDSDPMLKKAFHINARSDSCNKKLRSKLSNFYYQGKFSVQPFIAMGAVLMPYVLSLVTRGGVLVDRREGYHRVGEYRRYLSEVPSNNLNAVYQLVRNCNLPDLISFRTTDKMGLLRR